MSYGAEIICNCLQLKALEHLCLSNPNTFRQPHISPAFAPHELIENMRQHVDNAFIDVLNVLQIGELTS